MCKYYLKNTWSLSLSLSLYIYIYKLYDVMNKVGISGRTEKCIECHEPASLCFWVGGSKQHGFSTERWNLKQKKCFHVKFTNGKSISNSIVHFLQFSGTTYVYLCVGSPLSWSLSLYRAWAQDSWDYFSSLAMSPLAKETGQTLVPGYAVSDDPTVIQVGDAVVFQRLCRAWKQIHPTILPMIR